jgi:hypothetical protein
MRRLTLSLLALIAAFAVLAARPVGADRPASYASTPISDTPIVWPNFYVQVNQLKLPAGEYLLNAQLLVGAGESATTCTARLGPEYGPAYAYGQATTPGAGLLAPIALVSAVPLDRETLVVVSVACTTAGKVKATPNTNYPGTDFHGEPSVGPANLLTAVPLH